MSIECNNNINIKYFGNNKANNNLNNKGALVFILSIIMAFISIGIFAVNTFLIQKTKQQIGVMKYTRKEGIINAILGHAINELKVSFASAGACSLAPLAGPTSVSWSATAPQFYHVGQFQIDILDSNGNPTGMFDAPESPPKVWITQVGTQDIYKIHIETTVCKTVLGGLPGRPQVAKATVDNDIATAPAKPPGWTTTTVPNSYKWANHSTISCPASDLIPLQYTGVINPSSWGGVWTLYFDRGFYSNLGQYEPVELHALDSEEFIDGVSTSKNVSPHGYTHITGSNDEISLSNTPVACPANSRARKAYLQIFELIKAQDPCGKIAIYAVGGTNNYSASGASDNPPWIITPITTPAVAGKAAYKSISADYVAITGTYIPDLCKRRPAGYFNAVEVAKHYVTNHQDPSYVLPAADRTKTHVLGFITDGTGFGTLRPPNEHQVAGVRRPISRSNIYYQALGGNCGGQGYIESNFSQFDVNSWYVTGDVLYEYDSGASAPSNLPLPVTSPALSPLPGGSFLVGSVRNGFTGACEPIFTTGPDTYSGIEYPYFIKDPKAVKARQSAPFKLSEVLNDYKPSSGWINAFAGVVNDPNSGVKEYPNAFMFFPMPMTDLDEDNIIDNGYSQSNFDIGLICQKDRESLTVAYGQFFKMLNLISFKAKASFEGLTCGGN